MIADRDRNMKMPTVPNGTMQQLQRSKMKSLRQYGVIVVVSVIAALSLVEMYLGSKATSELTLPFYNPVD